MNSYVGKRHRGLNGSAGDRERGRRQLGKSDVHLRYGGAADADGDRMSTGFARVCLPSRMILIVCVTVMVIISCCRIVVIVRSRPVVVIWVIVSDVFVDVQRRRHGRRCEQELSEQECDQPAHGSSVLRPCRDAQNGDRCQLVE